MDENPDHSGLETILASLGQELSRPLDALQEEILRLLGDPGRSITETQRSHTETMLALCEDLRKLTAECLGVPGSLGRRVPDPE